MCTQKLHMVIRFLAYLPLEGFNPNPLCIDTERSKTQMAHRSVHIFVQTRVQRSLILDRVAHQQEHNSNCVLSHCTWPLGQHVPLTLCQLRGAVAKTRKFKSLTLVFIKRQKQSNKKRRTAFSFQHGKNGLKMRYARRSLCFPDVVHYLPFAHGHTRMTGKLSRPIVSNYP